MLADAPKQQPVANADEEETTSNSPLAIEEPVGEVTAGVVVKILIDLEEEPAAIGDTGLPT